MSVYLEKKLAKRAKAMAIGIQFKATERVDFFSSYFSKKKYLWTVPSKERYEILYSVT